MQRYRSSGVNWTFVQFQTSYLNVNIVVSVCLVRDLFLTFRNWNFKHSTSVIIAFIFGFKRKSARHINIRLLHATACCQIALGPTYSSFNSLSAQIYVMAGMVVIADAESTITQELSVQLMAGTCLLGHSERWQHYTNDHDERDWRRMGSSIRCCV